MKKLLLAVIAVVCVFLSPANAAITHIAADSNGGPSANTFSLSSVDSTGANLAVLQIAYLAAGPTPTIADTHTGCASPCNTWTVVTGSVQTDGVVTGAMYHADNFSGGTSEVITVTGTGIFSSGVAEFFSSLATSSLDVTASTHGNASTLQAGSVNPSNANSLIVAGTAHTNSSPTTIDSGFSTPLDVAPSGSGYGSALAYIIETTIVAKNPTWTYNSSNSATATNTVFAPPAAASTSGFAKKKKLRLLQ